MPRSILEHEPFLDGQADAHWTSRGTWPCSWVGCTGAPAAPWVAAFRLPFAVEHAASVRVHVSADERYELWLDGVQLGRGPERGDHQHWFFETYDLALEPGQHMLVARVWALGQRAPIAQISLQPGFLFAPEAAEWQPILGSGHAPWQAKLLDGYRYTSPLGAFAVGYNIVLDGTQFAWGWQHGAGDDWQPVQTLHPGYSARLRNEATPDQHLLLPATLPPMLAEAQTVGRVRHVAAPPTSETHAIPFRAADHLAGEAPAWQALLDAAQRLTLPVNTRRRILIDLENYFCAYPLLRVSGGAGATVRMHWQESLFEDPQTWRRGNRNTVEGRFFTTIWQNVDGLGDQFLLDGGDGRDLRPLWWHAGRYVELLVETQDQPLTVEQIVFEETRYPLENVGQLRCSDQRLEQIAPIAWRAVQMCAHETYMDCPYYEQLMYVGDTRLQCLLTYALSPDERLPRKALQLFDWSRLPNGLTQSRYPSRLRQLIPPFSLWWVAMVHDYLFWRDDLAFVGNLLPGVRAVLDFYTLQRENNLVRSPQGWNYIDWVETWPDGVPVGGQPGEICALINWQYAYALTRAAEIEAACGERELAARWQRLANETVAALTERFWDAERGLYADDADHTIFSEHSQCLAILCGVLPPAQHEAIGQNLFTASDLTQPTVYFAHYLFEACAALGRIDLLWQRLEPWFVMHDGGFKTTYENADPATNRSDCHGWSAHPLYHIFASIAGIKPSSPGFATVVVAPQLGPLSAIAGTLMHPRGEIAFDLQAANGEIRGTIALPKGVRASLPAGITPYSGR